MMQRVFLCKKWKNYLQQQGKQNEKNKQNFMVHAYNYLFQFDSCLWLSSCEYDYRSKEEFALLQINACVRSIFLTLTPVKLGPYLL